jgi:uncharacterized protein YcbX
MIEITELKVFPVKSLRGIAVERTTLGGSGLAFDRHWMVTDPAGRFVTQREVPAMATIRVRLEADALVLEHPSTPALAVDLRAAGGRPVEVTVWQDHCEAVDEGREASQWLSTVLGSRRGGALRLVRFAEEQRRPVDPKYLRGEQSHTEFSDGFPFLVTAEASLAALNERLAAAGERPVRMDRFRPNIVVRGLDAFEEDRIDTLTAEDGRYGLGLRKPCRRCSIITTDQVTGTIDHPGEPLNTLRSMNSRADLRGAFFGQNAILLVGEGTSIAVGDRLASRFVR